MNIRPLKPIDGGVEEDGPCSSSSGFSRCRQEGSPLHVPFASRELEAILRIYIKMFQLIEPELEAALAKESAERAA